MTSEHEEQPSANAAPASGAPENHPGGVTSVPVDDVPIGTIEQPAPESAPVEAAPPAPVATSKPPASTKGVPTDDVPKDDPTKYSGYVWPEGDNPHVADVAPVFHPLPDYWPKDSLAVSALPCNASTFNQLLDAYPSINYGIGDLSREWSAEISSGSRLLHQGEFLTKAVNRENSTWSQRVPYGAGQLGIMRPPLPKGNGGKMSGDMAAWRVKSELGVGTMSNVPLWHSGIWLTLRSPSTRARLELQQRIDQERIELGRMTSGLAFSNTSVYIKSYLVDFALAHVSVSSAAYTNVLDLKDKILCTDIPQLIWGMLTTMYPHGYTYHQPCINDPMKCQHIVKDVIDINKISFTDIQRLNQAQLKHMSERGEKKRDEQIDAYQTAHAYLNKGLIEVKTRYGSVRMQLKVPTISEYTAAGYNWVDGIVNTIQQAFGSNLQGEQRNTYILQQAKTLSMGEYSQWVKEIGFNDSDVIDDVDSIRNTLAEISGDEDLAQSFFSQVMAFMEESTLSLIAIPQFNCPACGTPSVDKTQVKHPYLNPIDVEALFFTMLDQHIEKALS